MTRSIIVYLCDRCEVQAWFGGSCQETGCFGMVRPWRAVLVKDIMEFGRETAASSSPVPASLIEQFTESLLRSLQSSSG